jgi:predicted dinucleotide-binding enzyme
VTFDNIAGTNPLRSFRCPDGVIALNLLPKLLRKYLAGCVLLVLSAGLTVPEPVPAETIAIIGTGQVSSALGPRFAELGHDIVYGSRDPSRDAVKGLVARTGHGASATTPAEAASAAGIVVLAVPGEVIETVMNSLGDLAGKIIIDPTNAIRRNEEGLFVLAVETSNAELIQGWAPAAHIVKAFNTLNWRQMADPRSSGGPISIPLVGDNADAKAVVATLVEGIGLEPIDLGPVSHARIVEGMLVLWINNRYVLDQPFEFHLRKVQTN